MYFIIVVGIPSGQMGDAHCHVGQRQTGREAVILGEGEVELVE